MASDPCEVEAAGFHHWAQTEAVHRDDREIYQTSTMGALLGGVYEGDVTIGQLLRHGDFGVGTFNRLDGEMLVLNGVCYQLRADGSATIAEHDQLSPFAAVTWFESDRTFDVCTPHDRGALKARIDAELASPNLMVAVRVTGKFNMMRTRTVAEQQQPNRPFTEVTKDQKEITFVDVEGTLVGFRMPEFEQGISVAGYHSHFIDADRSQGGHTLDYQLAHGTVEIGVRSDLHLSLQRTPQFLDADLNHKDLDSQIRQTEGG